MVDAHDVAAVLAERLLEEAWHSRWSPLDETNLQPLVAVTVAKALEVLTAAGYAVVRLPEGVTVEHGARLVAFVLPASLPVGEVAIGKATEFKRDYHAIGDERMTWPE